MTTPVPTPPPKRRKLKNFLQIYLEYTEASESPELFHFWSAVSIVCAALGRKCWVSRGYYNCYPNQYIILVSDSARCRKTTAADIAVRILRKSATVPVIMEKMTSQALSRYMHERGEEVGESSAVVYSPELGTFLGPDSYISGLMLLVTTLYGCPDMWEYRTKNSGVDVLQNAFLHILGCTTPSWLSSMPTDMIEGGFSSRCIYVVQNIPRPPQPRPVKTSRIMELEDSLIHDLSVIHAISGEFTLTENANIYFDEWYCREYAKIDEADPRIRAYFARKGEHVCKVAMALSASEGSSRKIEHWHIQQALALLKQVEALMPSAFMGVSFSASTKHMERVVTQIREAGGRIEHAKILNKNYYHMDKDELHTVIETLIEGNVIRMEIKGTKRFYILLD